MVQVYGISGVWSCLASATKGSGVPTQTLFVELGQEYFDTTTTPWTLYIFNGSTWVTPINSTGLTFTTDSGVATTAASNINILGGTNIATSGSGSTVTVGFSGVLGVTHGGTGAATLTAHGVLMGEGTSAVVASSAGTAGQVFTSGGASADGAYAALGTNSGLTAHGVLLGENNSAIVATAAATNGEILIGSTGADPVFGHLTPGAGIIVTEGAGTLSVGVTSGGLTPNAVAGTSSTLVAQNSFICNNATQTLLALPVTSSVGDFVLVLGSALNTGGFQITQGAGQIIVGSAGSSTSGATGTATSAAAAGQSVGIMCVVANTTWVITQNSGTITLA